MPRNIGGGPVDPEQTVAESRRDFLKKAGKFAVYTPPAVMVLMKPSYATVEWFRHRTSLLVRSNPNPTKTLISVVAPLGSLAFDLLMPGFTGS